MAKIKTVASTSAKDVRRMIRISGADTWFEGVDAALLSDAILSGIGDATGAGIEMVNETVVAKLIRPQGDSGVEVLAYDDVTGEHVPMEVEVTLKVVRRAANASEHARICRVADVRRAKQDAKKEADAQVTERTIARSKSDVLDGIRLEKEFRVAQQNTDKKLADQLKDAAEVFAVLQSFQLKALSS